MKRAIEEEVPTEDGAGWIPAQQIFYIGNEYVAFLREYTEAISNFPHVAEWGQYTSCENEIIASELRKALMNEILIALPVLYHYSLEVGPVLIAIDPKNVRAWAVYYKERSAGYDDNGDNALELAADSLGVADLDTLQAELEYAWKKIDGDSLREDAEILLA